MYIRFKLKDLQDKYTNLYPGGNVGNFPRCGELADRTAELLLESGHPAQVYECCTNGLVWRVRAKGVSPETTLCVWVGDLLSPREMGQYLACHDPDVDVSDKPLEADLSTDPIG
jgi:hypothetical protein